MELHQRIANYILKNGNATLTELEERAVNKHGIDLNTFHMAIDKLHRDKRIKRSVKAGEIQYQPTPAPKPLGSYLSWTRTHYPWPTNFEMPFPEIDYSWMMLRTREERDAYRAAASGKPVWKKKPIYN